jgi:predicted RND superfamily exporter protein
VNRAFRFVTEHAWWVLALALACSVFAASRVVDFETGRWQLDLDVSVNRLLPEDDEGKKFYDRVRLVFGSDETILVAYHADDLFTPEHLGNIRRLTDELGLVDGVHHVTSLANRRNITGSAGGLLIAPLFAEIPHDPSELERVRETALENPIFAGKLLSEDARTAVLLVYLRDYAGNADQQPIDDEIVRIVAEERGTGQVWITGQPHVKVATFRALTGELRRYVPLILLLFAVVLGVSFRSVRGMVLPLSSVVIALIWTLAVAVWIGRPLNPVTMLAPLVLLILGLSYSVHVVSEYYDELRHDPELSGVELMHSGLTNVSLPVALTGFTTGVGFLAMMFHPLGAIREVGQLLLVGIGFSVLVSLTVLPALLAVLPKPRHRSPGVEADGGDRFSRFAEHLGGFLLRRRRAVFTATGVVFALFSFSATRMEVTTDGIRNFSESAPVRVDFEAINERLGGANSFSVIVEASYRDAFKEPQNLREIERLQSWLSSQPEIGGATSIVDYITIMNRAFNADDPDYEVIPESRPRIASLLLFGANDDLDSFVDGRNQMANIVLRTTLQSSSDIQALEARIQERLAELPDRLAGTVTGNPIVIQRMLDEIIWGQVQSVVVALVLIYLILWASFLDWRTGLRALLPNVLPLVGFFGGMGLFGVPLGTTTSLIAPMALGIAIDDTLHYFIRFKNDAKALADERLATVRALHSVGRPVTYTTITLCLGFLVLTDSELASQMHFGAMAAFALAFAWVVDFTLTPALCAGLRVVTLWDTLTLDLGRAPQESIPLFNGLTARQCRIVAQMANLRSIPSGQPLFRAGDEGHEMYVVIDGKLRVYLDTDTESGHLELATQSRGEVTGEVGFFGGQRSSNIDVVENARLLRLTPKNMRELARRKPRIASVLLLNLGRVLADRVSDTTVRERDLAELVAAKQS